VFHRSSGSSAQELAESISFGVVKVNVDTDNQYAFTRAVAARVRETCEALGSAGRGLANTERATRRPRRGDQPAVKSYELSPPTRPLRT
jgi:fructose/tagatose bisphosphate aldolase